MSEPLDENNLLETLLAFADGELDPVQSAAVVDYLIAHPEWLTVMRDHQRLRLHARRVLEARTPPIAEDFHRRIVALAAEAASDFHAPKIGADGAVSPTVPSARVKNVSVVPSWLPLAAAAAIALVVGIFAGNTFQPRGHEVGVVPTIVPSDVPPTLVAAVTRVHVNCSRLDLAKHSGSFPTASPFDAISADVRRAFHREVPYPDLKSIGYEFVGAGPCERPLDDTVHLLYRATSPALRETLSILVQPYSGQINIPAGRMTAGAAADAPHPAYVWRTEKAVYFLVTDDSDTADRARDALLAVAR